MRRMGIATLLVLALSACDPAYNPYMALGKDKFSTNTPTQEFSLYFNESTAKVFAAMVKVGSKGDRKVVNSNEKTKSVTLEYPFGMFTNVWGGRFDVALDEVGGRTRAIARFYEKSNYVDTSILNPFIEDVKQELLKKSPPAS